ncbi:VOC family protein [Rhodococcus sp. NPDC080181]|uniref:VOC family protein n=1 Tax=Rhodococcus sp. NPDC080181 TaxID=3155292 RepID=UPI00344FA5A9
MRINITSVFVDDQDKALAFYTDVLGLVVKHDIPMGGTDRWLTVVSPQEPEGTELVGLGVSFTQEPTEMGPVITAVFDDTCGNLIQIIAPVS